jgi:hypothetical protein
MKIRAQVVVMAVVLGIAATAGAQPGTAFLEGHGGALIPVGHFNKEQNPGGAYSIAAGYEFTSFLDGLVEFTHSFNDTDDFHFRTTQFTARSDEVAQNFIVSTGPRINFASSDYPVRPYMVAQVGWYHFARFNSIEVNHVRILDDEDIDAVGLQGGLGIEGTILSVTEHRGDRYPLLDVTLGVEGVYHQTFIPNRPDKQMVTAMATLGFRF